MEYWRQCASWLINCKVLPPNHRVTWESAQVFDLAQTLRDGVLLCQLLNNLQAQTINLKEINLRPQLSQFLCLKNIRTFLCACLEVFGMRKSDLFEPFDLFDVRDFGKVMDTLSKLSNTTAAQQTGIRPFPTEESVEDEDIYNHLEDLIDENGVDDEEDLYDCVYDDDGGEVYEDLMKAEAVPPPQAEMDIRFCCLAEIRQTEEKYTETLESIERCFLRPLEQFLSPVEIEKVFVNIPELVKVHKGLLQDLQNSISHQSASNLFQVFIDYKERLLIYGEYCSHVETAIACLDNICKDKEDVRQKLEVCSKRANNGKFTLRDLLVVPMQRVLKYHLLLQELVKHTHDSTEKSNLRRALDAMKDLAQYVNEVKRDNETLREIDQYQKSIENLNQCLRNYGRPKGDGEVRVTSVDKRAKQDRHIFLFDAAVIVCKRRGDVYEMKEVIDLHRFKITNNPTSDKENRKWSHGFYLTHNQGQNGFEFFFKTKELKKKWLEQFGMAISNIHPENGTSNLHEFHMHTFDRITACSSCKMLLRGIFNQGYQCSKCGEGAHKECLGRVAMCGKGSTSDSGSFRTQERSHSQRTDSGLPKMLAIRNYYGIPSPVCGPPVNMQEGDIIELIRADLHSSWWQGKVLMTKEVGFFPSDAVKPFPCAKPIDYSPQPWFVGRMQRIQAEAELVNRKNSTYLVRHRGQESNEYAISIKYNNDVKHIKILTRDGYFQIAENRRFRSILELIEYYKNHSLKEGFRTLDTTLQFAYREPENGATIPATVPFLYGLSFVTPAGYSFVPPSCAPFWSVLTPKVIGVAIARYDFCSRDTRELSLQEGDIVKIYTKSGANGWWRGEVNGRVGWFPSTYVEEGEE
ncbi:guanine nucleotide exchange factor VAV3 isoform X2 [Electrophorus electricus]|uniref:guanine nucleotide exchange factor VAV3 isoform X2 n=1 Tax=Electrophorus electricus TaxID=8005 RepID=UPI000F0A3354|nr:guanine nucleotide exchange factor VAV3 isoform X2 [Electrophorus electricus]